MSDANFVAEIKPRPDDPSCHVCGAEMVPKEWKCLSCGATTGVVAALPEGETNGHELSSHALCGNYAGSDTDSATTGDFGKTQAVASPAMTVDSDEHIATIVGPKIREIYGDTAELGHYKLAIAVFKMAMQSAAALVARKDTEVERLQVQLAGCSVAALGWSDENDCKPEDYGYSGSYGDVVTLRHKWKEAEARSKRLEAALRVIHASAMQSGAGVGWGPLNAIAEEARAALDQIKGERKEGK